MSRPSISGGMPTSTKRPRFRPGIAKTPQPAKASSDSAITGAPKEADEGPKEATPKALYPGSVAAKVIARIWRGGELTIVDSPPGAGKTALVVTTVAHLAMRAGMKILIGTPTRAQGAALIERLLAEVPARYIESGIAGVVVPGPIVPASEKECRIRVATLAKCRISGDRDRFDLLVVDEAYQATNAIVSGAAAGMHQVLMVGDPGQIGPVVTVDVSIWRGMKNAPHLPAPEAVGTYNDIERFHLDKSWRLGPASAAAIAPVYPFAFSSANVARSLVAGDGTPVAEIEHVEVARATKVDDLDALGAIVDRVRHLMRGTLAITDPHTGAVEQRTVEGDDVAVVVSRNSQVSIVTGMLRQHALAGVSVGTADRLQGKEWPVVVALDPLLGSSGDQNEHNLSIGRLCVMASRHNTHLTWIHDDAWPDGVNGNTSAARIGRAVRKALVGESLVPAI